MIRSISLPSSGSAAADLQDQGQGQVLRRVDDDVVDLDVRGDIVLSPNHSVDLDGALNGREAKRNV